MSGRLRIILILNTRLEYKNDTYGIGVQYPADWEVRPGESNSKADSP
ncbi:MAG TPA: hypothetical protein VH500_01845 [Nitrososphaeraceae archaeon]